MTAVAIDLFCGVGGLTHGLQLEGLDVVAGLDSDGTCAYAYEHNNKAKFLHKRVEDIDIEELRAFYPVGSARILVGCAPCQPFSAYTGGKPKDEKWKLLSNFSAIIDELEPDIVSMENVPRLKSFAKGIVYDDFVGRLVQGRGRACRVSGEAGGLCRST